ncbi:TetR/AcrR family transcriptional regulator [Pelagicoccus sp. NFK12]|uniref:TetR/AcrR family transcriptional regulator n=1 Tax=Pelagicoccus enzymogenes TaxID=2773457 RepID=A0A927F7T3_9BACT|nr:TetR/AcrR family transcriptional regulator [Pelagicoccus enzymogenes]MBD5780047.1 TetR/AcrR family transcriptional regulator [Pelagicoccus enzymogenes]
MGDEEQKLTERGRGRPKTDPRDAETRLRLIRAGLEIATERGYVATGVGEVLRRAAAPKGCFYHYFKDKEDFGLQLIDAYEEFFAKMLDRCFENRALSPMNRLKAFVDAAKAGMEKHQFRRGCLVGNLGQEIASLSDAMREKLIGVMEDWQGRTAGCLALAQDMGELSVSRNVDELAAFFWIGWEGAVLRAKLELRADPLDSFAKVYFHLLKK